MAGVDNEFLQHEGPGGLLPPAHGSSFRSSINRLAARSSMNSSRNAHSALDPHALEEAALARRGVLLARVVQAVNLNTLGYSRSKLDEDNGGSRTNASGGSLPSYASADSRGHSSGSSSGNPCAFERRNNDALACGGGSFRVCLLMPDGGIGGCGDAYASPWRQAVSHQPLSSSSSLSSSLSSSSSSMAANLGRKSQTGKSLEISESSHAAAHVLWNGAILFHFL